MAAFPNVFPGASVVIVHPHLFALHPAADRCGDQIGRKKVIVLGNIFFRLLTVASAFAPNINILLELRFLAGLGLGCSIPSAIALAVEYAPEQHRSFRVSILFVGYTLGAALGG